MGHFRKATVQSLNLITTLNEEVSIKAVYFRICLWMQLMTKKRRG